MPWKFKKLTFNFDSWEEEIHFFSSIFYKDIEYNHVPDIVAEFHVEVAIEDGSVYFCLCLTLLGCQRRGILEDVEGRLAEYPSFSIISRYHSHADTQIAVTTEDVYGTTESRSLRSGDVVADQQCERRRQEEEPRAWPHLWTRTA